MCRSWLAPVTVGKQLAEGSNKFGLCSGEICLLILRKDRDEKNWNGLIFAEEVYHAIAPAFAATFARKAGLANASPNRHACVWMPCDEVDQRQAFFLAHNGTSAALEFWGFDDGYDGHALICVPLAHMSMTYRWHMPTLADLRARRETLSSQRASGVARVSYDGKTVDYRSLAEIDRAIEALDREIAMAEGRRIVRQVRVTTAKGL
jgi:hypothetical protein